MTDQLDDGLDAGISVSDGCATTANNIGTAIESRVNEVMTALEVFGIDPNDFYDDFIASGNEELQSFAKQLQITFSSLTGSHCCLKRNMKFPCGTK